MTEPERGASLNPPQGPANASGGPFPGEEYLTPQDLSRWLKISLPLVYKWVRLKEIPFYHFGKVVRFAPEDIRAWLEEKRMLEYKRSHAVVASNQE